MSADGGRIIQLSKRREREKADLELQKQKVKDELQVNEIATKFTAHYDAIEETLKSDTVGLVTLDEMMAKQKDVIAKRESQLAHKWIDETRRQMKDADSQQKGGDDQKVDEDEENPEGEEGDDSGEDCKGASSSRKSRVESSDQPAAKDEEGISSAWCNCVVLQKVRKDPTVDTTFLPDREREQEENRLREELRRQWVEEQERQKSEEINIAFAYWDGSGHRRDTRMRKGATISQFLAKAVGLLRREFSDLRSATADSLMFVKEDLIIPQFYTFQDFIVTKAMGKTGPLFEFDAAADIRLRQDAALDSDSHPGKVVLRSWYEKNKHIYPASRWEPFVPNKKYRPTFDDLQGI